MLPPPVVLPAIADGRLADAPEDDDDEFKDVLEPEDEAPEVKHRGPEWKFRPDKILVRKR